MCSPAFIPLAIGVVGGAIQGKGAQDSAYAQASMMDQNAQRSMQTADDIVDRGRKDADWQRVKTQQDIGTQRVAQAANNGMVDQDTNALLNQDVAMIGELDAQTIANNAAREAYGFEVQAQDLQENAKSTRKAGKNAMINSILGGAAQGMSGFSDMGGFESIGGNTAPVSAGTRKTFT